ncbi:MAG: class I lanthipeptide [Kordia sp.]|uniref:class I lanthipeptide n=1 Tax=Kordia sp. TaxID=1965332 RepID=UPI00385D8174
MKMQKLSSLMLRKESITNLNADQLKGGHGCPPPTQTSCWCNVTRVADRCPI